MSCAHTGVTAIGLPGLSPTPDVSISGRTALRKRKKEKMHWVILRSHPHLSGPPVLPLPTFHHYTGENGRTGSEKRARVKGGSTQTTALLRPTPPQSLETSLLNFRLKADIHREAGKLLGQVPGRQRAPTADRGTAGGLSDEGPGPGLDQPASWPCPLATITCRCLVGDSRPASNNSPTQGSLPRRIVISDLHPHGRDTEISVEQPHRTLHSNRYPHHGTNGQPSKDKQKACTKGNLSS